MQAFLKFFGILVGLLVALVIAAALYVQNANHLKPELEALIAERTGIEVTLGGDLSWQLWPPIQLTASQVTAADAGRTIRIEQLALSMDVQAFWQDMSKWRVDEFHLTDTELQQDGQTIRLAKLDLTDFAPNTPADLSMSGEIQASAEAPAYPFTVDGEVTYAPASDTQVEQLSFNQTRFSTTGVEGVCDVDVRDNPRVPSGLPAAKETDLLPLETLLSYDVIGDCAWSEITLDEQTFTDIETKITNLRHSLNLYIQAPDFFSGSMITEVDITLWPTPVRWHVLPELTNVDSKQLLDWRNRSIDWRALFATNSDMTFTGNSLDELYKTVSADSQLDGQPGQIDITGLKKQLANIALLTRQGESVADWPDIWNYQNMTGSLITRGENQVFDFVLDHLHINGEGKINYLTETVDMLAHVTIGAAPEGSPYRVNPILEDTPLPFRCRGPSADVKCKLDEDATKSMIARALSGGDDTGLRRKLEQKIDEEVPEEYREAAKGLLDILGRALEDN